MPAEAAARPPNPKKAAISAKIRKARAQRSMVRSSLSRDNKKGAGRWSFDRPRAFDLRIHSARQGPAATVRLYVPCHGESSSHVLQEQFELAAQVTEALGLEGTLGFLEYPNGFLHRLLQLRPARAVHQLAGMFLDRLAGHGPADLLEIG